MCVFTRCTQTYVHVCTLLCACFPRARKSVCSRVQYTCVCVPRVQVCVCVCVHVCTCVSPTCTHMCVHVCTHVCSNWVFYDERSCVCSGCTYMCVCVCSRVRTCVCVFSRLFPTPGSAPLQENPFKGCSRAQGVLAAVFSEASSSRAQSWPFISRRPPAQEAVTEADGCR